MIVTIKRCLSNILILDFNSFENDDEVIYLDDYKLESQIKLEKPKKPIPPIFGMVYSMRKKK